MGLLGWGLLALVLAIIAGVLGFAGIAKGTAYFARLVFSLLLLTAIVLFILVFLGVGAVALL